MTTLSRRHALVLSAAALIGGCARRRAAPPATPPAPDLSGASSLKEHAAARGIYFGCAVALPLLASDPSYTKLVREQCSMVVAENAMKWSALHPAPDRFDFDQADALFAFAEANGMKVRGHNLCWHRQLPQWFAGHVTTANARTLLTTHIAQVAGRYAGRVHSWDVVNEAVQVSDGRPDGLRESPWLKLLGPDYIETAFHAAREADPQALLTYNDYGMEAETADAQAKRAAVLMLVRRLKARRVPLDAVGLQAHLAVGAPVGAGLASFCAELRQLGLILFVTELDVNDRALPPDTNVRDKAVAQVYADFMNIILREPGLRAVLTWGLTDRRTWLNGEDARADHLPERCLPFGLVDGRDDQPKQAFFALRNAFDRCLPGGPGTAL